MPKVTAYIPSSRRHSARVIGSYCGQALVANIVPCASYPLGRGSQGFRCTEASSELVNQRRADVTVGGDEGEVGIVVQMQKAEIGLAPRDQEATDRYSISVLEGEWSCSDGGTKQIMRNNLPQHRMVRASQLCSHDRLPTTHHSCSVCTAYRTASMRTPLATAARRQDSG